MDASCFPIITCVTLCAEPQAGAHPNAPRPALTKRPRTQVASMMGKRSALIGSFKNGLRPRDSTIGIRRRTDVVRRNAGSRASSGFRLFCA
jgi:hypothetical protein